MNEATGVHCGVMRHKLIMHSYNFFFFLHFRGSEVAIVHFRTLCEIKQKEKNTRILFRSQKISETCREVSHAREQSTQGSPDGNSPSKPSRYCADISFEQRTKMRAVEHGYCHQQKLLSKWGE